MKGFHQYVWPGSPRGSCPAPAEDHVPLPHSLWCLLHVHLSLQLSFRASPNQRALGRGTRAGWGEGDAPLHDIVVCVQLGAMASFSKTAETTYKLLFSIL